MRVTAYELKFVSQIKAKTRKSDTSVNSEITVANLAEAEMRWINLMVKERNFENWKRQFGFLLDRAGVWRCKDRLAFHIQPSTQSY